MIFIGLGANLGNREKCICDALLALEAHPDISLENYSSFYETEPVGKTDQPDFINAVAEIKTRLSPLELLKICLGIEAKLGRVRAERWGPRVIDIDLLLYNQLETGATDLIELPHPRMSQRRFVLTPLVEIAALAMVGNETASELLVRCPDSSKVKIYMERKEVKDCLKGAQR